MELSKGKMGKKKKSSEIKMQTVKWLNHAQFHGANRLADGEASWYWIPSMILILIFASILIFAVFVRYLHNATYMLQTETSHTILPFPSVIICPEISFHLYKQAQFLSTLKYPEGLNESYVWRVLPQLAAFFSPDVSYKLNDLVNLEILLQHNKIDVETAGRRLTQSCEETLIRCRWKNTYHNCSDMFQMELSSDGFCCVFNGRSLRREMQEVHIRKATPVEYVTRFGFSSGLMVAINQTQKPLDIDLTYKWIALQGGQDFIDHSINGTPLNPGSEQWVAYYTQSTHITDDARGLGADLRRCSLTAEGLKYFPVYAREYCQLECIMAATIKRCHCVRMGHPRPKGVSYCSARRLACSLRIAVNAESCQCLPTCDVERTLMKSSSFLLNTNSRTVDNFYNDLNFEKVTVVRTFVQQRLRKSKQRASYLSYLDLFSQIGGMFNLFFGCSVLTVLGLVQFFCRLMATLLVKLINRIPRIRKNNSITND